MKHNLKITAILLAMFIITQFIGLYVISSEPFSIEKQVNGTIVTVSNPSLSWINPPKVEKQSDFSKYFGSIIFAFIIAITLLFLLTKFKAEFILKIWFFVVVVIALSISFIAIFKNFLLPVIKYAIIIALVVVLPLAFIKVYRRNFLVHNVTELFIYPGIAAVFVPILNVFWIMVLLVLISIYDMWAVWKSGIMQKMAKYQIKKLNIFSGFFVPYLSKRMRLKLQKMRKKIKKSKKKDFHGKRIRVNIALLGGGDIIFPIIAAGVMLKTFGLTHALFVIAGATLGISYLFFFAEKKKFYPAMPFISIGIFIGIIAGYLLL